MTWLGLGVDANFVWSNLDYILVILLFAFDRVVRIPLSFCKMPLHFYPFVWSTL